ncbi:MAG: hypothetical protein U0892_00265 [Pirellulales bacterium]
MSREGRAWVQVMMGYVKQFAILCMLAIAGAGPIPLALHHALCHSHGPHAADMDAAVVATNVHGSQVCSGHVHCHAAEHLGSGSASAGTRIAVSDDSSILSLDGVHDDHESCAICYFLAQAAIRAGPTQNVDLSELSIQLVVSASEDVFQGPLHSYATRGPPTV